MALNLLANAYPGVGSFLANPGLSKEQHLRRCVVRTFVMVDIFMETPI